MLEDTGAPARLEIERGMSYLPRLTLALIALNIVVFGWELASGALTDRETIIAAGALARDEVAHGQVWRLITAPFLHGSLDHIVGNCLILYVVGMALEHAVGITQTLFIYSNAAVAGSLLSALMSAGPSVGASGAIFGVLAAVVVILVRHRDRVVVRDRRIAVVLGLWAAWQILSGFLNPYLDNFAHVGGALGGALTAWKTEPMLFDRAPS